jgi:hypothetical protein
MNLLDIAPLERWARLEKKIHQKSGLDAIVSPNLKSGRISCARR